MPSLLRVAVVMVSLPRNNTETGHELIRFVYDMVFICTHVTVCLRKQEAEGTFQSGDSGRLPQKLQTKVCRDMALA